MKIRLIEIGRGGVPARCPGVMPPLARDAMEGTDALYEAVGFVPPWIGYLADRDGDIVGTCAFTGPPMGGRVEIAYHVFPDYEKRGIGTEMARQLVRLAAATDPRLTVIARTQRIENASTAILRKLGFALEGPVEDPADGPLWQWTRGASIDV